MTRSHAVRCASGVAAGLLAIAFVTALIVHMAFAPGVRDFLGFGFGGVPDRLGEAIAIAINNLRLLAAVLLATVLVQLVRRAVPPPAPWDALVRLPVLLCDAALGFSATAHAVLVGAGVGAYGGRMVAALVPHGPVELAAFSLALGLYVAGRRGLVSPARGAAVASAAAAGLIAAALLETSSVG